MNAELDALKSALDDQREHVLGILEGLSEHDLRRPALPTGWNCLELVRHLTLDVERFWFPGVIAGDPDVAGQLTAGAEAHWHAPEHKTAAEIFEDYRAAVARSDEVLDAIATTDNALEHPPAVWPMQLWPDWRLPDVRSVLLHVLTEVACHAGHLDAARELLDGTTWLGGSPYPAAEVD